MKKNFILDTGHGTIVKLHGNTCEESTVRSAAILGPFNNTTYGLIKLLESRYWKIPEDIVISVMRKQSDGTGNQDSNQVSGADQRLKNICETGNYGSTNLKTEEGLPFVLHWYLVRDQKDAQNSRSKFNSVAHVGLIDKNEIYFDFNKLINAQYRLKQLRMCGVYGNTAHSVILYVEPKFSVHPNGVRTQLVHQTKDREGELVDIGDFASTISSNLPQVIVDSMTAESTVSDDKNRQKIEKYLKILEREQNDTLKKIAHGCTGLGEGEDLIKVATGSSGGDGTHSTTGGNIVRRRRMRESGLENNANKINSLNIPKVRWAPLGEGNEHVGCSWNNQEVVCNTEWAFHESQIDAIMKVVRPKTDSAPVELVRERVTKWYTDTQENNILMTIANIQRLRERNVLSKSDVDEYTTDPSLTAAMFFNLSLLEQAESSAVRTIMK